MGILLKHRFQKRYEVHKEEDIKSSDMWFTCHTFKIISIMSYEI